MSHKPAHEYLFTSSFHSWCHAPPYREIGQIILSSCKIKTSHLSEAEKVLDASRGSSKANSSESKAPRSGGQEDLAERVEDS